eukprot:scaffold22102_cov79-Isochrysis_galbana.AAC.1
MAQETRNNKKDNKLPGAPSEGKGVQGTLLCGPSLLVLAQVQPRADRDHSPLVVKLAGVALEEAAQQFPCGRGVWAEGLHGGADGGDVGAEGAVESAAIVGGGRHGGGGGGPRATAEGLENREDGRG